MSTIDELDIHLNIESSNRTNYGDENNKVF